MKRKLLFTSPGRRVELVSLFKRCRPDWELLGADSCKTSPASYFLKSVYGVGPLDDEYACRVLEFCRKENIACVVPLIDPELLLFAKGRELFAHENILLLLPSTDVVNICRDKFEAWKFFSQNALPTPQTWKLSEFLRDHGNIAEKKQLLKPTRGSASQGLYIVNPCDLNEFIKGAGIDPEEYILQEYIDFDREITIDVFGDGHGGVVEYCQRERLKTRAGEVERGVTVDFPEVNALIQRIASLMKFSGVANIQIMMAKEGCFIGEINPRFGGGYPLAHAAGVDFVEHIDAMLEGRAFTLHGRRYKTGLYAFRYDHAVFTETLLNLC